MDTSRDASAAMAQRLQQAAARLDSLSSAEAIMDGETVAEVLSAMREGVEQLRRTAQAPLVKFVSADGREVTSTAKEGIEIRSPGAGWRWHDADGNEWGTGIGTNGPVWRIEVRGHVHNA